MCVYVRQYIWLQKKQVADLQLRPEQKTISQVSKPSKLPTMKQVTTNISRRHFLKISTLTGGGILLGFELLANATLEAIAEAGAGSPLFAPNAYLSIDPQAI